MSSVNISETSQSGMSAPRQRTLTIARALNEAIHQEMTADSFVVVLGEDVAKIGDVWSTTVGLLDAFGLARVRDTPIQESGLDRKSTRLPSSQQCHSRMPSSDLQH